MKIFFTSCFLVLSIIGLSQNSTSKKRNRVELIQFFATAKANGCLPAQGLDYENPKRMTGEDRAFIKGPSLSMKGMDKRVYDDFTVEVVDPTSGAVLKTGTWSCGQFTQTSSSQNCSVTFQIPSLPFRYIDNRKFCIYCRTRYIPFSKVDINEYKKVMTLTYVSKQIDKHCEEVGADNKHKASHIVQVSNLSVKKGYFKTDEDANLAFAKIIVLDKSVSNYFEGMSNMLEALQQAMGSSTSNNNDNEFAIKLYDNNNTKFCSREHEDRYNRRY